MPAAGVVGKYSKSNTKKGIMPYNKIPATEKWVEYSLDIMDMQREMISTKDYDLKCRLLEALEVAERKRAYMYRHKNFELERAAKLFSIFRDIPVK